MFCGYLNNRESKREEGDSVGKLLTRAIGGCMHEVVRMSTDGWSKASCVCVQEKHVCIGRRRKSTAERRICPGSSMIGVDVSEAVRGWDAY